jgi:hypothetical protein
MFKNRSYGFPNSKVISGNCSEKPKWFIHQIHLPDFIIQKGMIIQDQIISILKTSIFLGEKFSSESESAFELNSINIEMQSNDFHSSPNGRDQLSSFFQQLNPNLISELLEFILL